LKENYRLRRDPDSDPLAYLASARQSRCVYRGENDVCDQQVVLIEFEGGATATLTMQAHTYDDTRRLRINGTRGELHGDLVGNDLRVRDFNTGLVTRITPEVIEGSHMGGDIILIDRFIEAVRDGGNSHLTSAKESLDSHLLAFAAEESRLGRRFVDMATFRSALTSGHNDA